MTKSMWTTICYTFFCFSWFVPVKENLGATAFNDSESESSLLTLEQPRKQFQHNIHWLLWLSSYNDILENSVPPTFQHDFAQRQVHKEMVFPAWFRRT